MMRIAPRISIFVVITCAILCSQISAATTETAKPRIKVSFSERIRIETHDAVTWLSTDSLAGTSYARLRSNLMLQWYPRPKMEFGIRAAAEPRYYFVPEQKKTDFDQLFIDQFYCRLDSVAHRSIGVTLGRQNIDFGEGFIVMDGSPLDGSRSAYFNAARVDWTVAPMRTLTLVGAYQPRWDGLLPILQSMNRYKPLNEQSEVVFMAFYNGLYGKANLQGYLVRKQATAYKGTMTSYPRIDLNCLGARVKSPLDSHFTVTGEAALQFGRRAGHDQFAYGGYTYIDYATHWPRLLPRSFTIGGVCLSGDDPTSDKYEGWDPMYSRFPKWSDSYLYALTKERAVGYWTNMGSLFVRTGVDISSGIEFTLDYHHLMAPQAASPSSAFPGGTGKTRGDLVIGKLSYKFEKNLTGHVLYESFSPGNYYKSTADSYGWMRMEVMLKY